MKTDVRIDKWLWAVRLYKTRSIATEACKKGRVSLKGVSIKPSRTIKINDIVEVRKGPVTFSFKVLDLSVNRMGAKLVPNFMKNITPPDQLEILEMHKLSASINRNKGMGRPTKKDRREIESFIEDGFFDEDFD